VIMWRRFAGQWSVFLRAAKICLMNRPMRRCLTRLRMGRNHSWSSVQLRVG